MRKVEQIMCSLLANDEVGRASDNTEVVRYETHGPLIVQLHRHVIAKYYVATRTLVLSDAGWKTRTTASRHNALLRRFAPDYRITQRDWVWYLVDTRAGGWKELDWSGQARFERGSLTGRG